MPRTPESNTARLRPARLLALAGVVCALGAPARVQATTACTGGTTACGAATTVTYNGVAMTSVGALGTATNATVRVELFYLKAPASGAHNIVVTAPTATDVTASSISFTGVNQTTPLGTAVNNTNTGTSASVVANTILGEPVVDIMGAVGTTAPVVSGATQYSRNTNNTSTGVTHIVSGMSTAYGQAAPITMSWTIPSADWAIAAVPIKAATALTGVDVDSFTATWRDGATFVEWRSGYQPHVVGFYVYRSNGSGPRTQLNRDLVEGNALDGTLSSFSWTDATSGWNGDVSYWLKEVDQDGSSTWYGPASPVPPPVVQPAGPSPSGPPGPDASADATGAGGSGGTSVFTGATGSPGSPTEVSSGQPQGGCAIEPGGSSLGALRLFLLAGVVWSARRRKRWILPLLFLTMLVGSSLWAPRKAAATGGVAVDATATATGASGLTFAHTMSASANGLLIVGVVTPITCANLTNDSGNCGLCGTTCLLDTSSLTSGLLDLWHFDEGTGTTSLDSSGNNNTATLNNGATWGSGYENNAVQGNGTSSYAQGFIGSWFANNNPLSAAAWVYVTSNTNGPVFGVTGVSGSGGWNMPFLSVVGGSSTSTVYGWIYNNTALSATVSNNAWHLLVLTYDSTTSTTKFYVDSNAALTGSGAFAPTASAQGYPSVYWTTYIPGVRPGAVGQHLLGRVDEVRAYNRVLSAAEVTSLYTARLACTTSMCATCGSGKLSCSGSCVTTATDNNNCGACGHVCNTANGETCSGGTCVCSNGSLTDCSTYCVSTVTDSNNCGMCGNTCSSATPTFVDSGLLGYWKLNEGTGTMSADSSGNNHAATLTNSPTWTTGGYSGNALTFDGTTNYLNAPIGGTFGTNTNISATGWVYATATTNGPIFGVTNTPPGNNWNMPFLSINGATVYGWVWYGAGGGTAQSTTVTLNAWHHLAVTYDPSGGGSQKFYVDGGLIGTQAGVYNPSNGADTFTTFISGNKPSGVLNYLKGTIDDLRAYNRTLSASEISIIYNARAVCSASACNASCATGETSCSGVCTITNVDPNNCGSCAHACNTAGGETCQAGVCACPSGQTSCSGTCRDLTTDINHCGTCTTACNAAGGETCITSSCGCASGTDCSGVCTDTSTSSGSCGACGMPCGAITCQSCTQGQLGLWHFDEGTGSTSADSSSGGLHPATLVGGPAWTAGYTGDGLTFNGANNYFTAPLTSWFGGNNTLSASAWVYATSTTAGPVFGVTNVAGGGSWDMPFLSINGATAYGWIYGVNGNTPLSATVSLNNWHFLAITYDPSAGEKFYVDGALSGSGTGTFNFTATAARFVTTYIPGVMPSTLTNQHYLNGTIDELSAYNRVLSAGEIKLLYDARQVCVSSMCSGCPTGTVLCGSVCTNTLADKNNCSTTNACGTVCPGAQTCVAGTCM